MTKKGTRVFLIDRVPFFDLSLWFPSRLLCAPLENSNVSHHGQRDGYHHENSMAEVVPPVRARLETRGTEQVDADHRQYAADSDDEHQELKRWIRPETVSPEPQPGPNHIGEGKAQETSRRDPSASAQTARPRGASTPCCRAGCRTRLPCSTGNSRDRASAVSLPSYESVESRVLGVVAAGCGRGHVPLWEVYFSTAINAPAWRSGEKTSRATRLSWS